MKKLRLLIATLFASMLLISSSVIAYAAPSGGNIIEMSCTGIKATKVVTVTGTYKAPNNYNQYKINGYRISLINNGGQQFKTTGLLSIAPTWSYVAVQPWTLTSSEGNSLRSALVQFYNGGTLKASQTTACTWS